MKDWNEKADGLTLSQLEVKSLQKDSKKIYEMIKITGANQNCYQVEEDKVLFLASRS